MKYGFSFSSTQDVEKMSLTVKGLIASLLPVIHLMFGIEIISADVDRIIDAVVLLLTAGITLYGYVRAKKALGARIEALGGRI